MYQDDDSNDRTTVLKTDLTIHQEIKKAKEQEACLILIRGFPEGQRYFLTASKMIIGRDPKSEISLVDSSISRRHLCLQKHNGKVLLTDLGSSNGTLVNNKKILPNNPIELNKEDIIQAGNSILKYLPAGELETLYLGNLSLAANNDPLTGLFNKGYLLKILEVETKRAMSLKQPLALIFFDIDFFKKINDTYGHEAGDFVLKQLCQKIKSAHIRSKDILARYGGEEFTLLLLNTSLSTAKERAEQIRTAVEETDFIYENKKISVTLSLGVDELDLHQEQDFHALLKSADIFLYQAKKTGRNKVCSK
jgi:two-component system cell cycle response regulator